MCIKAIFKEILEHVQQEKDKNSAAYQQRYTKVPYS